MKIKRVEIIGFKSFCDRAVVNISEQVTGVVGPNGCGKSNIVDAIRWCMGEQSAKHLRGKAMEDVIFAGSESRGPAPMAEVSLTFDDVGFSHEKLELARHSDEAETERALAAIATEDDVPSEDVAPGEGMLESAAIAEAAVEGAVAVIEAAPGDDIVKPAQFFDKDGNPTLSPTEEVAQLLADSPPEIDFSRYTEVTITRRLYRDGTSQYFINKTPCRLRDITDFFLGTGVGTKAYAIIEQGRIGQIVSARPGDRRAIIEEAAGITKFKAKKKAAEKKLDQTRQNLMRVSDIVTELDKRMGTLRRQAQKAERYRKYKSEMKDIELWKASHRWLELSSEGGLISGRLAEAGTELEEVRTRWTTQDAHVIAERADLSVEERRLVGVQEIVYELENRVRLGESKIGFERREAEELDVRISGARSEIEAISAERTRGAEELTARQEELTALEAEVERESAEVAAREAAAGEGRQMLTNAQGRLDEARAEIGARKTEIATSNAQLESLTRRKDEASRRLERVMTETEQHTERVRELDREGKRVDSALTNLRQTRLDLGSQNQGFEERRDVLADQVARGEAEVETLRTELHRRTSRLTSLKEIQDRYEGFARGTRAVMQRADGVEGFSTDDIRGVVADVVRAPEMLEIAVEAALGDRLGGVLVSQPEVGLAAISYLKRDGGGRSAFVPMQDARAGAVPVYVPSNNSGFSVSGDVTSFGQTDAPALHEPEIAVEAAQIQESSRFEGEGNVSSPIEPTDAVDDGWSAIGESDASSDHGAAPSYEAAAIEGEPSERTADMAASDLGADALGATDLAANELSASTDAGVVMVAIVGDRSGSYLDASANRGASDLDAVVNLAATDAAGPTDAAAPIDIVAATDDAAANLDVVGDAILADAGATDAGAITEVETRSEPQQVRRSPILVEDRTQLTAAHAALIMAGKGAGVLGRMSDLVDFEAGYAEVGRRLLGTTVVVEDLDHALRLHHQGVTDRMVTLDGDVVDDDGVVAGGSRDAQGAGVLAQKREIRDLEEITGRLEHDLSESMTRLVTARTELKQIVKALEGLRTQVHEGDLAIMGHEKDEVRVRHDLERYRDRLGQLGTEQLELEERLRVIVADDQATRERRAFAEARIDELERVQLDLIAEVSSHRDRLEEMAQVLTEARIRAAQLGEKRAAAETSALRLQRADAELGARGERLTSDIDESVRRAATLREGCDQLAAELTEVRERRDIEVVTLDEGRLAYQNRLTALTEIELTARDLRGRADKLAAEVNQLELRSGQIAMTRKVVEDQIDERYQLEVAAILPDFHQRPMITDVEEARLSELRELIERMGTDINLTAIEEFADVNTRFEFLSSQKIDLERAVDQLQRAIDKINKTSRKLFKDTFAAVNATFKEVFPRLFRGGQAALSLSGGEDVDLLEAGVEIMAQPPGKKNSTVDQLSGGEKALTAVALVFSIFLIKPSPFCILDEVDAPLDEANVDRYNELVREMTDRSQFIVITHNKRTMESVDNLYGVTMKEPGVSMLVSVNLSKLGARAGSASSVPSASAAL